MNDASVEDFGTGLRGYPGVHEPELTQLDFAIAKVEQVLEPMAEPLQPMFAPPPP